MSASGNSSDIFKPALNIQWVFSVTKNSRDITVSQSLQQTMARIHFNQFLSFITHVTFRKEVNFSPISFTSVLLIS